MAGNPQKRPGGGQPETVNLLIGRLLKKDQFWARSLPGVLEAPWGVQGPGANAAPVRNFFSLPSRSLIYIYIYIYIGIKSCERSKGLDSANIHWGHIVGSSIGI